MVISDAGGVFLFTVKIVHHNCRMNGCPLFAFRTKAGRGVKCGGVGGVVSNAVVQTGASLLENGPQFSSPVNIFIIVL